jgi:peptide/nickel transport system permease protein
MMSIANLRSSPVLRLTCRRALQAVPVLWGVTFMTFGLLNLLPGTAAQALLGSNTTRQAVAALTQRLHLNDPFLVRYWHWLSGAVHGNFGTSLASGVPVTSILAQRLPVTAELAGLAFLASVILAVPVALVAARKPRGLVDRITVITGMFGLSIPDFVFALLLILVFAVHAGVVPAVGFTPLSAGLWPNIRSLLLPAASLGFALFCSYTRLLRADIIDQLASEDYVITARAKGVPLGRILVRHALRNSLFSLLTLIGLNLGRLIGGTVIIEQIFDIPGMGQELLASISNRDITVVEAIVVTVAVAVVCANLLTDVLYVVLDPRIRHGSRST